MGAVRARGYRAVYFAIALLSALAPSTGNAQTTTVAGFSPGSFQVSPGGAATYAIPIQVPPGIAGLEPRLALSYSSQGGNGLLGMGWALSGLSLIHRCPRTIAQDGAKGGINYDANDRFCLDGQRLMSLGAAPDCANGIEYRTELEGFTRVISCGVAGNGPASFKAWTKAGQIMEYGNTADSRIEAVPATASVPWPVGTVGIWALNKTSDRKGNYLAVTYTEDNANGDYFPIRIDYTGNAGTNPATAPSASVRFVYQPRSDVVPVYVAGSVIRTLNRLINVQTYVGAALVRDYRLAYSQSAATSRSLVISITECAAGSMCLPATSPSWQINPNAMGNSSVWNAATLRPADGWFSADIYERVWAVDVNGDGLVDLLGVTDSGVYVQLNTGTGFQAVTQWNSASFAPAYGWFSKSIHPRVWAVDVNGDGLVDLLGVTDSGVYVQLNTGTSFQDVSLWNGTTLAPANGWFSTDIHPRVWPADVNGDGLVDLLGVTDSGVYVQLNTGTSFQDMSLWNGASFAPANGWFSTSIHPRVWPADVNGDGLVDLLGVTDSGVYVQLNTGTSFQAMSLWSASDSFAPGNGWFSTDLQPRVWPVDVNGDGLVDLLGVTDSGVYVQLSTGTSFQARSLWNGTTLAPANGWFSNSIQPRVWVADINGDGLVDLLGVTDTGVYVQLNNNGTSFQPITLWNATTFAPTNGWFSTDIQPRVWTADVNGDGFPDLLGVTDTGVYVQLNASTSRGDLVNPIQGGLGTVTAITYKPLTDKSVYAKDSGTFSYPVQDVQFPQYVVSSYSVSNGIGGSYQTNYTYAGAKVDLQGRGFLGFRNFTATDPQTQITNSTTFRQDYPYTGMPSRKDTTAPSGVLLNRVDNTPAAIALGGTRFFPFTSQSVSSGHDLNGAVLPTVTTTTVYDAYGNPTSILASTGDGYSKTTTNTYATPDTVNWFIGRLTRSAVTSVTP